MSTPNFLSCNPRTGERLQAYRVHSSSETERLLEDAHQAYAQWRLTTPDARATVLREVGARLAVRRAELAGHAVREMGKHLGEALAEVDKCVRLCDYLAKSLREAVSPRAVPIEGAYARVRYVPTGLILGIMPWNYPYWQVARFALPAIAAGNACLLKHAENVQACAQAFCAVVNEAANAPLLSNLRVRRERIAALIHDGRVTGVSLTGSTEAGRAVGRSAGEALKPCVLELGGSDPYVVLADADLERAVEACLASRMLNAGQSCISAKRLIVVDALAERFAERLAEELEQWTYVKTDPAHDGDRQLAPLARADLRDRLHRQVTDSVKAGARLLLGGEVPAGEGYFYPPTLLSHVEPGMPAFDEELFGPAVVVCPANSDERALELANATSFGLGAAVFTRDVARGEALATQHLQAGSCFVNDFVRSDPRLPFGGIKASGIGRELSLEGVRAFCNAKTVYVAHPSSVAP